MLLALFDYAIAVVTAEVGEPGLCDDGFAMGGGGSEMTLGYPAGDGFVVVVEEFGDRAYGQHVRLCAPFSEEVGHVCLALFNAQIGLFSALLDRCKNLRELNAVDGSRAPENILAEYGIASCMLAGVDAWDESVLEHPGAFSFADT